MPSHSYIIKVYSDQRIEDMCTDNVSYDTGYTVMQLRQLLILSRDLTRSTEFFQSGLRLSLIKSTESFAEFDTKSGIPLCIKAAQNEAVCSTGYSPFLNFNIENMDDLIPRLLTLGATLDGPIKYPAHGKIAAVRSPDGVMIGLYESNSWESVTSA
ncbi:unnamed protein product [Albugo candida]|nr:unnamed protein product [Albugo candida]|eukprot:CCI39681.1 unnamed protein product [Albugo candida]